MQNNINNKIAVLGAGVMGSQIALEFARYGCKVYLFDQASIKDKNQLASSGIEKALNNISPKDKKDKDIYQVATENIVYCNFDDDLDYLTECIFVIEAIIENITAKKDLFSKIKSYLGANTVLASNTSGLDIEELSHYAHDKNLFCGFHFFNPPRHLPLIEYIPIDENNLHVKNLLAFFQQQNMQFKIIKVKNTPNFIVNKIGFFAWLVSVHSAKEFNLPIEVVDELSGNIIGRSKSATYRTADIVGLDIVYHVL
jgi:3-hydroxyacyl-CoA dehydrogenase